MTDPQHQAHDTDRAEGEATAELIREADAWLTDDLIPGDAKDVIARLIARATSVAELEWELAQAAKQAIGTITDDMHRKLIHDRLDELHRKVDALGAAQQPVEVADAERAVIDAALAWNDVPARTYRGGQENDLELACVRLDELRSPVGPQSEPRADAEALFVAGWRAAAAKIRDTAREFDLTAAEAGGEGDHVKARADRDIALQHWQIANVVVPAGEVNQTGRPSTMPTAVLGSPPPRAGDEPVCTCPERDVSTIEDLELRQVRIRRGYSPHCPTHGTASDGQGGDGSGEAGHGPVVDQTHAPAIDLMAALKTSLERAKAKRDERAEGQG